MVGKNTETKHSVVQSVAARRGQFEFVVPVQRKKVIHQGRKQVEQRANKQNNKAVVIRRVEEKVTRISADEAAEKTAKEQDRQPDEVKKYLKTKPIKSKKHFHKPKHDGLLYVIWGMIIAVIAVVVALVFCVFMPRIEKETNENARMENLVKTSNAVVKYQQDHAADRSNLPVAGIFVGEAEFPENCDENSACRLVRDYLNPVADTENEAESADGTIATGETDDNANATETLDDATENNENMENPAKIKNHFKDPDGEYYNLVITDNLATTRNAPKVFQLDSESANGERLSYNGDGYEFIPETGGKELSHTIYLVPGAKCLDDLIVKATKKSFAVVYNFESGATCLSGS